MLSTNTIKPTTDDEKKPFRVLMSGNVSPRGFSFERREIEGVDVRETRRVDQRVTTETLSDIQRQIKTAEVRATITPAVAPVAAPAPMSPAGEVSENDRKPSTRRTASGRKPRARRERSAQD